MKTTLLTTALILVVGASVALASDKDAKDTKKNKTSAVAEKTKDKAALKAASKKKKAAPRKEKVALTGSYIKREVRRNGQITDGPSPVAVLDSKAIQNSGAADLRQLLTRQGVSR